jgi:hypothetical protein
VRRCLGLWRSGFAVTSAPIAGSSVKSKTEDQWEDAFDGGRLESTVEERRPMAELPTGTVTLRFADPSGSGSVAVGAANLLGPGPPLQYGEQEVLNDQNQAKSKTLNGERQ